jgi:hypothetical protein
MAVGLSLLWSPSFRRRCITADRFLRAGNSNAKLLGFLRRLFFSVVGQMVGSTQKDTAVRIYQEITAVLLTGRDYLVGLHLERLWAN